MKWNQGTKERKRQSLIRQEELDTMERDDQKDRKNNVEFDIHITYNKLGTSQNLNISGLKSI